jgi:hypothetical protein
MKTGSLIIHVDLVYNSECSNRLFDVHVSTEGAVGSVIRLSDLLMQCSTCVCKSM